MTLSIAAFGHLLTSKDLRICLKWFRIYHKLCNLKLSEGHGGSEEFLLSQIRVMSQWANRTTEDPLSHLFWMYSVWICVYSICICWCENNLRRARKQWWTLCGRTHTNPPTGFPSSLLLCKALLHRSSSSLKNKQIFWRIFFVVEEVIFLVKVVPEDIFLQHYILEFRVLTSNTSPFYLFSLSI